MTTTANIINSPTYRKEIPSFMARLKADSTNVKNTFLLAQDALNGYRELAQGHDGHLDRANAALAEVDKALRELDVPTTAGTPNTRGR